MFNVLLGVAIVMLIFNFDDFGMSFYNNWISLTCFTVAMGIKILEFWMDMGNYAIDK